MLWITQVVAAAVLLVQWGRVVVARVSRCFVGCYYEEVDIICGLIGCWQTYSSCFALWKWMFMCRRALLLLLIMSNVTGSTMDETKRESKLTVKALANKIETLQKERKTIVNKMKEVTKQTKRSNAMWWKCQTSEMSTGNANKNGSWMHSVTPNLIPLIPEEEHTKQNEWFNKVLKNNAGFIEDGNRWLEQRRLTWQL